MSTSRKIAFGYSTLCNIQCGHCIAANEDTPAHGMKLDRALELIEDLADCNVKGISFTAGEPLIFLNDILSLLQVCGKRGLYSRVVTNGFWASTPKRSDQTICNLVQNGLSQLRISFSRWHEKHVNRNNIVHAVSSCKKYNLDYFISFITDFSEQDESPEQFLRDNRFRFFPEPLIYFGRAQKLSRSNVHTDYQPNTCMMNPYLSPELDMFACCDAGHRFVDSNFFFLGNLKDHPVEELFRKSENNPLYNLIRSMGLTDIASYLGYGSREIITYRKCEMCEKIFNSRETVTRLEEEVSKGLLDWKR